MHSPSLSAAKAENAEQLNWLSSRSASSNSSILKSSPIAIARNGDAEGLSDDDSDSSSTIDVELDDLRLEALQVGSLPTRSPTHHPSWTKRQTWKQHKSLARSLPMAPRLHAREGPEIRVHEQNIPPMALTEACADEDPTQEAPTCYGSLRESHMAGKFLDGPMSYREKGTGQIFRFGDHRRVRFDISSTSYDPRMHDTRSRQHLDSPSIGSWSLQSPGERMQALRKQSEESKDNITEEEEASGDSPKKLKGSLSSLLLSSLEASEEPSGTVPRAPPVFNLTPRDDHSNSFLGGDEEETKLSTSLTALEILKQTSVQTLSASSGQEHTWQGHHMLSSGPTLSGEPFGSLDHHAHDAHLEYPSHHQEEHHAHNAHLEYQSHQEEHHPECFDLDMD